MAGTVTTGLRAKADAAWANLGRQLEGMEPHLDTADAPGQWTTRQVLSHVDALDRQRQGVFAYLDGLPDADLQERKARIPLFKQIAGSDEVPMAQFVRALYDYHWNDHAGQLGKIRQAAGLPAA
jgi:hypothetical protein